MINFKNITVKYKSLLALDNVSIDILENEITAIIGPNGSGKSTLFNTLYPINKKLYTGEILIDDKNVNEIKPKDFAKIISLNSQVKPEVDMYVYELIEASRYPYGTVLSTISEEDNIEIDKALEITGTSNLKNKLVCDLSGGERQMVYLAASIAMNTKYLFFDEPNTYLDVDNQKRFFEIIKNLKAIGKTIVIILHDITEALEISDRLYILKNGQAIGMLEKKDYLTTSLITDTFKLKRYLVEDEEGKHIFFK